jgi:two-component system, NtrC family, nitrogen regulation sensor histidine kinase NtrY
VNRLRNRLILIFVAATILPLGATLWITRTLFERSLRYATAAENDIDALSRTLEATGREYYQHMREELKARVEAGSVEPHRYPASDRAAWPEAVEEFSESGEPEQFVLAGNEGDRLDYLVRRGGDVWLYSASTGGIRMGTLSRQIRAAREVVEVAKGRDLLKGFTMFYVLLAAFFWATSLALLVYLAHRVSRPIQRLTAGLATLAAGDLQVRVPEGRDDEVGRAILAFNDLAIRLKETTDRLVYLGQMASWQALARKMAHELKNSLTPIRLTVEEMIARYDEADRAFIEQAGQIVVEEVESLERRIRAFSQFAAEPPVRPSTLDVNAVLEERIAFLRTAHPEVAYECRLAEPAPSVEADGDLLRGILTNLLENAADAAGAGGRILGTTHAAGQRVSIEVHDSGPGLSEQAKRSLFQPTISFKKRGMGLGLSIARKSALLSGGDLSLVKGELGGAAFRVVLPASTNGSQTHPDRR